MGPGPFVSRCAGTQEVEVRETQCGTKLYFWSAVLSVIGITAFCDWVRLVFRTCFLPCVLADEPAAEGNDAEDD
jgi:hypothetical protein